MLPKRSLWVKVLAINPDELISRPKMHMIERQTAYGLLSSDFKEYHNIPVT